MARGILAWFDAETLGQQALDYLRYIVKCGKRALKSEGAAFQFKAVL